MTSKFKLLTFFLFRLNYVHNHEFIIHRDFHSGNILSKSLTNIGDWIIGDLGLSHHVNNTSSDSEIYGVIPYIAPEIFKGAAFSKKTDIYSFGMIMWELTTGCKPFANVNHDIHLVYKILYGERPNITEDTPEFYANLMKSCWNPNPKKRPSMAKIYHILGNSYINLNIFIQAEAKRCELLRLRKIGPEFAEKCHSGAIYTSRPLSALISECSSTHSTTTSFGNKEGINKKVNCN
jgi:serine/threonine protein kinase